VQEDINVNGGSGGGGERNRRILIGLTNKMDDEGIRKEGGNEMKAWKG
jgi:hypothetical protein